MYFFKILNWLSRDCSDYTVNRIVFRYSFWSILKITVGNIAIWSLIIQSDVNPLSCSALYTYFYSLTSNTC